MLVKTHKSVGELMEEEASKPIFHGHPRYLELTEEELALHSAKNKDYAGEGNPLGNFLRVGNILSNYPGLDPSNSVVVALIYALKQWDAVAYMLSQEYEGEVEGVADRLQDIYIYTKIMRILYEYKQ